MVSCLNGFTEPFRMRKNPLCPKTVIRKKEGRDKEEDNILNLKTLFWFKTLYAIIQVGKRLTESSHCVCYMQK